MSAQITAATVEGDGPGPGIGRTTNYSVLERIQHTLHRYPALSPAIVLVASCIVFTIFGHGKFAKPENFGIILQQVAVVGALAVGQTIVILTAGIDLSVGTAMVLAHIVMARLASVNGWNGLLALLVGSVVATLCGALNGGLVTSVKLPPFIVTLGTLNIFTAVGLLYGKAQTIQGDDMPQILQWMAHPVSIGSFKITSGVLLMLAMYVVFSFVLANTAWGRHLYAVGDDAEAARLAGIDVKGVLMSAYVVAGVVYALGSWIQLGRAEAASSNAATNANLESITAVVIGGTSLFGGRGLLWGTLLGALIVGVFQNGLALANVDQNYRLLAIGVLVIVAVATDQWIRRIRK